MSLGSSRNVVFEQIHSHKNNPIELTADHNSAYAMSRSSQAWYRHSVPQPSADEALEERFSITFRCLNKKFSRSLILIGDSNSKDVNFGTGFGKVGESFPGRRVKAAKVADVNPQDCVGYSNIFVMCGTNNLRVDYIKCMLDIVTVVDQLKDKLHEIRQICPKSKVFVVPVLPSRSVEMNRNIATYNKLVDQMLAVHFPEVSFTGIYEFLDRQGMLNVKLTRTGDSIHLNDRGVSRFVTYMKRCVVAREQEDRRLGYVSTQRSAPKVGQPAPT